MEIKKEQNGTSLTMFLSGRLDTVAAVDFEKELDASLSDVTSLILDCTDQTLPESLSSKCLHTSDRAHSLHLGRLAMQTFLPCAIT